MLVKYDVDTVVLGSVTECVNLVLDGDAAAVVEEEPTLRYFKASHVSIAGLLLMLCLCAWCIDAAAALVDSKTTRIASSLAWRRRK